jgi:hypothetical protein
MYPDAYGGFGGGFGRGRRGMMQQDWRQGYTWWTNDYPRSDRHLMVALRRLTRLNVRSVEQAVNPDDGDEIFDWPFIYATTYNWNLTDQQAKKLREFIDRGGFLICDDFWGAESWDVFMRSMSRIFPDRPVLEIDDKDPVFHTVYDLDERFQIAGQWSLRSGVTYLNGGSEGSRGAVELPPGASQEQLIRILELLAGVDPSSCDPLEEMLDRVVPRLPWGSSVIVAVGCLPELLLGSLQGLVEMGHRPVVLLAGDGPAPEGLRGVTVHRLISNPVED